MLRKPAALILMLLLAWTGALRAQPGFDPENCMFCHGKPWMAVVDSTGVRNFHIDEATHKQSVHGRFACRQCHTDVDQVPHKTPIKKVDCSTACHVIDPYTGKDFSHLKMSDALAASVHGRNGESDVEERKPLCKDCHTNVLYSEELPPLLAKAKDKCEACHEDYNELEMDFQHLALHMGQDDLSRRRQNFAACVRCHSDNDLVSDSVAALLVDDTMVSSFLESFHGRGFSFGDARSPVCADCHGTHAIQGQDDPRSMIHRANLQKTCSTTGCHDGATVAFATAGSMHNIYQGTKVAILLWVKRVYILLILATLGGMLLHNLLDLVAWRRHKREHPARHAKAEGQPRVFKRLTGAERASHVVMFVSFTVLALTGALLWIPPEKLGTLTQWPLFMPVRDWSHRVAAIVLTLVSFYHVGYALFTRRGRVLMMAMLPGPSDIKLFFHNLAFLTGRRKDRPPFGFFNYGEKMEYWAFAWGSVVMTGTGVILWFEHLGSKFVVDLARLVHSLEAILAVAAIVVWHFWNVHWKPGRWPMSTVWIDGRMSEEDMEEEHGGLLQPDAELSYDRELLATATTPERRHRRRALLARGLGWSFLLLTIITCGAMIWSFRLYLGLGGDEKQDALRDYVARPLQDKQALAADADFAAANAHRDADWRYARFHEAKPVIEQSGQLRRSECLLCHSSLPHQEDRKTRAFLNLHSRFMTCEACHAKPEQRQNAAWAWLDLRTSPDGAPKQPYGLSATDRELGRMNLTSLIGLKAGGQPLFADLSSARAQEFRAAGWPATPQRRDEAKERFHDRVAPGDTKGVTCNECHIGQGGLLDFEALGFDAGRAAELRSSAITTSVTDNEVFYLPPAY